MALTRVSRHIIDDPFNPTAVSATDVTATNINASGIGTIGTLRVTGDLTVEGTTTTLDSIITEVDRLEVSANSTVAAGIITQTGNGDGLLVLGGNVGIGTDNPSQKLQVNGAMFMAGDGQGDGQTGIEIGFGSPGVGTAHHRIRTAGGSGKNLSFETQTAVTGGDVLFKTSGSEALRITSDGRIGIGQNAPATTLEIKSDANAQTTATIPTLRITNDDGSASQNDITGSVEFFTEDTSDPNHISGFMRNLSETNAGVNYSLIFGTKSNSIDDATERLRITSAGNIGIGTENAVAKLDIITGTGDGTQNEANCLRLRNRGNNGNAMTLQVGVNTAFAGALNQGYAYLQGRFWGGGNNPILLNPKGGNVGIGRTSAHVPLDVNGDTILRAAGTTTQGDITRRYGFTGSNNTSNPHSYIAGVADKTHWYQGFGLVFGTVSGNDIGATLGVERMRITSDGDVGIGTDNPEFKFHSNETGGSTIAGLFETNQTDSYISFQANGTTAGSTVRIGAVANDFVAFVNSATRFTITGFGTCRIPDDGKLTLGAGDDLEIEHDTSQAEDVNVIKSASNLQLQIRSDKLRIIDTDATQDLIHADVDGSAKLFYAGSKKLETTTTGAKVTGALEVTQEYPSFRPTLDLNFAATKTLDRRITFTRDSLGTYIDENGSVKYASNNVPRFDHDPTTRESLGLLIEESRTNYIDNSNDISQWNRIINNATVESNTTDTLSPDGTNTSTKITGGTNSGISRDDLFSASASTTYTSSIFAKKGTADSFKIEFGTGANNVQTVFNLTTKAFSTSVAQGWFASVSTSYVDYPNGWVRVIVSGTTSGSVSGDPNFAVYGISSGYVYFWGGQAEVGSFVTSLIPTHGSTVTRAADFATIKGTNFTDFYNQTEGTLFGEFTIKDIATSSAAIVNINQEPGASYAHSIMFVEIGTAAGYFGRTFKNSSGQGLSNGSSVANLLHPSTTPQTVSFGYTSVSGGELRAYWNGNYVNSSSVTSYVPTTLTNMRIGRGWGGSDVINAHIRKLSYYPKRLPDAQLQGLTQQ